MNLNINSTYTRISDITSKQFVTINYGDKFTIINEHTHRNCHDRIVQKYPHIFKQITK